MSKRISRRSVDINISDQKSNHVPIYNGQYGWWDTISSSSLFSEILSGSNTFSGSQTIDGNLVVSGSIISYNITSSLEGTASWARNAISSSYPIAILGTTIYSSTGEKTGLSTNNSIYLGSFTGVNASGSYDSNFIGYSSGYLATNAYISNFIGSRAGEFATNARFSNFFGYLAGYQASGSNNSNYMGLFSGYRATSARYSNFIGSRPGYEATEARFSNFFGNDTGYQATNANDSNFFGYEAGFRATNASYSNFIGNSSGQLAASASYSTLIGFRTGYNVAGGAFGIRSNNVIIGTNITLENGRADSINIGGIIFGTGSYSTITGNPFSGSANGLIGINQPIPVFNLDVSGSGRYTNGLQVTGSLNAPTITGSLFGTASWANNAISSSQAQSAVTSSYPFRVTGSTIYSTSPLAGRTDKTVGTFQNILIGESAGADQNTVSSLNYAIAIGYQALSSVNTINSNSGSETIAIGRTAANAMHGRRAIIIGAYAGVAATNADTSIMIGLEAGYGASNARNSILIGQAAGGSNIGPNNIIIGTNITLASGRQGSINIGGLIFGTGSYSTITGNPFSGSANGRIGINQPIPLFSVDVSGSGRYTSGLQVTGSLFAPIITGSLFGTASWAQNAVSASYIDASNVQGLSLFRISTGSISASLSTNPNNLFLINSGSAEYLNISSSGNAELYSDLFIVKNFTTKQPVLIVSQSIVRIATQSFDPIGTTEPGSIWFTSTAMYVGIE